MKGKEPLVQFFFDLGGGSTTAVTVIHENKIKYATIDLEGGIDNTNDIISACFEYFKKEAEKSKLQFGYAGSKLGLLVITNFQLM